MEQPQRRDINELLVNGYFTTSRARSPSAVPTTNSPSFLQTPEYTRAASRDRSKTTPHDRSRSREPRRRPPPRPTVEDEAVSIARESSASSVTSYDPPLRGIIDQNPIILEADVSAAEAARLHAAPCPKEKDDNQERRFVLIPKSDTHSPTREDEREFRPKQPPRPQPEAARKGPDNLTPRPPIERRRSRQDLPSLQTKVPRDIPPQFRRSASAYSSRDDETTPRPANNRMSSEYLLSPDVPRGHSKDYFGSAPRHSQESFGGRNSSVDKRSSAGSISRPSTPLSEKRNSGNFDKPRSRRNTNEKLKRPQKLSEEDYTRRDRHASTHSARLSAGGSDRQRSGRSSPHSGRNHYSSSESDIADSDSDRGHRHRHHRHKELQAEEAYGRSRSRSHRSSAELKPSRYNSSPLPSPKVSPSQLPRADRERADTFPQRSGSRSPVSRPVSPFSPSDDTPRPADRLNPLDNPAARPRSRQAQTISTPTTTAPYPTPASATLPIPIPIPMPAGPGDRARPPPSFPYDENRTQSARPSEGKSYWQPPAFQPQPQPSPSHLDKPIGAYRRHSEDVERGAITPLPSCPRTKFVCGKTDWLTLPKCPSFDICPSCFNSTIAPTEFRNHFIPSHRGPKTEVLCDFGSSPWYRIAWLLTRKERRHDLNLFYGLANIAATVPECAGKAQAVRQWHSVIDHKTRTPVNNFHVCYSCVKSVEMLLPPIRGVFVQTHSKRPMGDPRVCDLRFDSKRFVQYFDALETMADKAEDEDAPADTRALVSLAKRMSLVPECERDKDIIDGRWNVITQLPEFTVCEECFDEVVWPELEDGKSIPAMFAKDLKKIPRASCQLYSPKMRGIFRIAVDGEDYKLLASKARERKSIETAYKTNLEGLKRAVAKGDPYAGAEIRRIEEDWRKWE